MGNTKTNIINYAYSLEFEQIGFAKPKILDVEFQHLKEWIANGYNAKMEWFNRHNDSRQNPALLLDNLRTIIVLAKAYPAKVNYCNEKLKIAKYAVLPDYHKIIKTKLTNISAYLSDNYGATSRCFVDSGAVMEKQWAVLSGIGWQGKHSLIINEKLGTYFNIGIVLTTLDIEKDSPAINKCGICNKCINSCPTNAIVRSQIIDCNRCISYHNIENRGDKPKDVMTGIQNSGYIYGCDVCADACPYNQKIANNSSEFIFNIGELLVDITEDNFNEKLNQYSIKRPGYDSLQQCIDAVIEK